MGTYNIDESIADGDHGQLDWAIRVAGAVNDLDLRAAAIETGGAYVVTSGTQTIGGVKTFSSAPVVPDASFGIPKVNGLQAALDAKVATAALNGLVTTLLTSLGTVAYATQYGVTANGTTDDTTAMQAALDAAATAQATLILPPGTIKISSGLTWKYNECSILGTTKTQIDARTMTTGVAISLLTTTSVGKARRSMADLFLWGPSSATTVNAIGHSTAADTRDVEFRRVKFSGFQHQAALGNNAYLWVFDQCSFTAGVGSNVYLNGTNMGENVTFKSCLFDSGTTAAYVEVGTLAGASLFFNECSFDFGWKVLDLSSGTVDFTQCHMEGQYAGPWITLHSGGNRPSVVSLNGGQIVAQAKVGDTLTSHTVFRIDAPSTGSDEVAISVNRTHVKDSSGANGIVMVVDNSGVSNNLVAMSPIMTGAGQRVSMGKTSNLLRKGAFDATITVATGNANLSGDTWVGSGTSISGYSFDTTKVTKDGTASGCAKFAALSYTTRNTVLSKQFMVPAGRALLVSAEYAYQNLTSDSSGLTLLVQLFAADDKTVTIQAETEYSQPFRGGLKNLTGATAGWDTGSVLIVPPKGTGYGHVRIVATNTTADFLWLRNVSVSLV